MRTFDLSQERQRLEVADIHLIGRSWSLHHCQASSEVLREVAGLPSPPSLECPPPSPPSPPPPPPPLTPPRPPRAAAGSTACWRLLIHCCFISQSITTCRLRSCWPTGDWNAGRCLPAGGWWWGLSRLLPLTRRTRCYQLLPPAHVPPTRATARQELGHRRPFFAHRVWGVLLLSGGKGRVYRPSCTYLSSQQPVTRLSWPSNPETYYILYESAATTRQGTHRGKPKFRKKLHPWTRHEKQSFDSKAGNFSQRGFSPRPRTSRPCLLPRLHCMGVVIT